MDIFDFDISVLCEQYIDYIFKMQNLHLEIESEYLIELATLVEFKSRKLLPQNNVEIDDEYEEDPQDRLIKRLLEYQKYRDVANIFHNYYEERNLQYAKPLAIESDQWISNDTTDLKQNPYDLVKAMNKILKRIQLTKPIAVTYTRTELSVDDKILEIKAKLLSLPNEFSFKDLVKDEEDYRHIIVSFLAILDLAKQHVLYFTVDEQDNIYFRKG